MPTLASGMSYVDVEFLGRPRVIATAVLTGADGVALIDPGPSSTLPALRRGLDALGIAIRDVRALLITHIHLDHAGAAGTLVRENPSMRVYVHEIGAFHLADPSKLLASAARLYGDMMDRLWGEFLPVPRDAIVALSGGERVQAGGRSFDVLYTPGHAWHHVSYVSRDAGVAFVGDTAGIRLPDGMILPPTPPPDIDLEAWRESLAAIAGRGADALFLTHFGPSSPAGPHLAELTEHLEMMSGLVKASLARDETDEQREAWFVDEIRTRLRCRASDGDAKTYEIAARFDLSWRGLARYWRKRL